MNGKDFLLSLNQKELFDSFYENYYKDDIYFIKKSKELKIAPHDLCFRVFSDLMKSIKEVEPTASTEFKILLLDYLDFDMETYELISIYDACLIKMNSIKDNLEMKSFDPAGSYQDFKKKPLEIPYETYSMMFIPRNELLGYEMFYIPEENVHDLAAEYLHELSWFGYDNESYEQNSKEEKEKLEEAAEEAKNPENLRTLNSVDLYKELGVEPPSEEEKANIRKATEKIIILNYNKKVEFFNKYIRKGGKS